MCQVEGQIHVMGMAERPKGIIPGRGRGVCGSLRSPRGTSLLMVGPTGIVKTGKNHCGGQ